MSVTVAMISCSNGTEGICVSLRVCVCMCVCVSMRVCVSARVCVRVSTRLLTCVRRFGKQNGSKLKSDDMRYYDTIRYAQITCIAMIHTQFQSRPNSLQRHILTRLLMTSCMCLLD